MASNFTGDGDFHRGKGGKKSRLGYKISLRTIESGVKKSSTPTDIALNKLNKFYTEISGSPLKPEFVSFLTESQELRFMNMEILAYVIYSFDTREFDNDYFKLQNMHPYLIAILDRISRTKQMDDNDKSIVYYRLAATFIRYSTYISPIFSPS